MKPSWNDAPEWANWLVKDQHNDWYFCDDEPLINSNYGSVGMQITGKAFHAGYYGLPGLPLFILESRREGESKVDDAAVIDDKVGAEDRIGLIKESIDWEAHKSFGRSL